MNFNNVINFFNIVSVPMLVVCSLLLVSLITLISLFIINRLGRFAGFILNRRNRAKLDKLFKQYSNVINSTRYYEDYAINKKHRQREGISEEDEEVSNLIIGKWVNSFISLSESKNKMTSRFKIGLRVFTIIIFVGASPILSKILLSNTIDLPVKTITVTGLLLLFRFLLTGINNFQITGFKLNLMSYMNMINKSKYKDKFERKIRRVLVDNEH